MIENLTQQALEIIRADNIWSWLAMAVIAVITSLAVKFFTGFISRRLRKITSKSSSKWDDVGVDLIDGLKSWVIFIWVFFPLAKSLAMPLFVHKILLLSVVVLSIFQVGIWGFHLIRNWRNTVLKVKIEQDPSSTATLGFLYSAIQGTFILTLVLIGLSNLGIDIGALLAGLGVGGIAIALAAQNVLGDLLASLSIVLDKPFVVGDFIVSGNEKGTVEHIGIKTTRLRSISGEELIISNKNLLESRIQNFKRMWRRRVVQHFGVSYSTSVATLENIPIWVKEFVTQNNKLQFDRCHFVAYGASSLDFEFVFFVSDPDYNLYMDLQQKIMLEIYKKFSNEGVEFAFPSQSIYVEKMPKFS